MRKIFKDMARLFGRGFSSGHDNSSGATSATTMVEHDGDDSRVKRMMRKVV